MFVGIVRLARTTHVSQGSAHANTERTKRMLKLSEPLTEAELARLRGKIEEVDDCWNWTSTKCTQGYGVIWFRGRQWKAHRLFYFAEFGELPQLASDHLCRNRKCVNPHHLEMVTNTVNVMRGESPHAKNALKTHCPRGHEYSLRRNNHMAKGFQRYCHICNKGQHRTDKKNLE